MQHTVADFLTPAGFAKPPLAAVLRERRVVREAGHYALRAVASRKASRRAPYAGSVATRMAEPVLLVPGFMAGDGTLRLMATSLQREGFRTYRSQINANVGCTQAAVEQLEERLERISQYRDSRVRIVGHSLGGLLARGLAARRPDLVSGIVTLGSPMLAPGAHHASLTGGVEMLVRLNRAGLGATMAADCVAGECARESFARIAAAMPEGVDFTAIYSRRDGIVDWRACIDPAATAVEVTASHLGMALDPRVIHEVARALRTVSVRSTVAVLPVEGARSAVEVDGGETA